MTEHARHDIADRLDAIAEEIADLGMDNMRSRLEAGESDRWAADEEKRLAKARRSVMKAAQDLRR